MLWKDWATFWAMGGYAEYVWGSFAVTFFALIIEIYLSKKQKINTKNKLTQIYHAENND